MGSRRHYVYLPTRSPPEGGCRYYVGIRTCPKRKTPETDTRYMGGGPWVKRVVKKHRAEFTKTIVETFDTAQEAKELERALVGLTTANSPYSYNLMEGGGSGGLLSEATKAKLGDPEYRPLKEQLRARGLSIAESIEAQGTEWKVKRRRGARKRYEDPAEREKTGASSRRAWSDATSEQRSARISASVEAKRRARAERQRASPRPTA